MHISSTYAAELAIAESQALLKILQTPLAADSVRIVTTTPTQLKRDAFENRQTVFSISGPAMTEIETVDATSLDALAKRLCLFDAGTQYSGIGEDRLAIYGRVDPSSGKKLADFDEFTELVQALEHKCRVYQRAPDFELQVAFVTVYDKYDYARFPFTMAVAGQVVEGSIIAVMQCLSQIGLVRGAVFVEPTQESEDLRQFSETLVVSGQYQGPSSASVLEYRLIKGWLEEPSRVMEQFLKAPAEMLPQLEKLTQLISSYQELSSSHLGFFRPTPEQLELNFREAAKEVVAGLQEDLFEALLQTTAIQAPMLANELLKLTSHRPPKSMSRKL